MPIFAWVEGTKLPICAIITERATCLMSVDFPAIFGPVIMRNWFSSVSHLMSFGTKRSPRSILSTTGCLLFLSSIIPESESSGLTYEYFSAASEREHRTSTAAIRDEARLTLSA